MAGPGASASPGPRPAWRTVWVRPSVQGPPPTGQEPADRRLPRIQGPRDQVVPVRCPSPVLVRQIRPPGKQPWPGAYALDRDGARESLCHSRDAGPPTPPGSHQPWSGARLEDPRRPAPSIGLTPAVPRRAVEPITYSPARATSSGWKKPVSCGIRHTGSTNPALPMRSRSVNDCCRQQFGVSHDP